MTSTPATLEDLDAMPNVDVLRTAADYLREDLGSDTPDDTEAAVLALMQVGAAAAGSDEPAAHRAVTAALAQVAQAMFREELAEPAQT